MMRDAKNLLGMQNEDDVKCFSLTYKQRMYGFAICFCVGCLISVMSAFTIFNLTKFAVLYTFGNMVALCSTGFLVGPWRQVRNMFHKKRVVATCVYLFAMVATLVAAFATGSVVLTLFFLAIEFLALVWYCLSYIPFARAAAKNCMKGCFKG